MRPSLIQRFAVRILHVNPEFIEVLGVLFMSAGVNLGTGTWGPSVEVPEVTRAITLTLAGTWLYLISKASTEIRSEAKAHLRAKGSGTFSKSLTLVALDLDYAYQSVSVFRRTLGAVVMLALSVFCSVWG